MVGRNLTRQRAAGLQNKIVAARKLNDGSAEQLEMLLRQIDDLRDGAFSPFSSSLWCGPCSCHLALLAARLSSSIFFRPVSPV